MGAKVKKPPPRIVDILSIAEQQRLSKYYEAHSVEVVKMDIVDAKLIQFGLVRRESPMIVCEEFGCEVVLILQHKYSAIPNHTLVVESIPRCEWGCSRMAMFKFVIGNLQWYSGCEHHYLQCRRYPELGEGKGFRLHQKLVKNRS